MTIQIIYNEYPLKFDSLTGDFTVGNVVYGATSEAYATIRRIDRSGTTGTLYLESITGTFQDNEIIYETTYEDELITNGDMELDADWTDWGSPTTNERSVEQSHGGTYSRKFVGDEISDGIVNQTITTVANYFYILTGWGYISAITADSLAMHAHNTAGWASLGFDTITSTGSFQQMTVIFQALSTGTGITFSQSGAGAITAYADDVSVKKITNAALANGTVQSPITIDLTLDRQGVIKDFKHERNIDHSYSGKVQIINQYGIQEMSINSMFSMATYYKLLAWWSWARQGKLWAFTMDSSKTGNTTLDGGAASGQKTIPLTATTGFSATDICLLKRADLDDSWEVVVIASVSAGVSVTATDNLNFNYTSGDVFRHLDYWPEVVSLDGNFRPTRTGVNSTSGTYWRNTFKFTEAL